MIPGLAFLPKVNIEDAIDVLRGMNEDDNVPAIEESLTPILNYFEDTYIGKLCRKNRPSRPLFEPAIWSSNEPTVHDEARTTNYAEKAYRLSKT